MNWTLQNRFAVRILVTVVALSAVVACRPSDRTERQAEARLRTLFNEWVDLAQDPDESLQGRRHLEILAEMMSIRTDAFLPILDVFSNPDTPPRVRLLAYETLKVAVVQDTEGQLIVPALIPLTDAKHDPMIRACAMELLALTENPGLRDTFSTCLSDSDTRVRLAALCALTRLGDNQAREELRRLYQEGSLVPTERNRVLLEFARKPTVAEIDVFEAAAQDPQLPGPLRSAAIVALGSVGREPQMELLQKMIADTRLPEDLRSAAEGASEAIQTRLKTQGAANG